jgi:hypothetical protein
MYISIDFTSQINKGFFLVICIFNSSIYNKVLY